MLKWGSVRFFLSFSLGWQGIHAKEEGRGEENEGVATESCKGWPTRLDMKTIQLSFENWNGFEVHTK